MFINILLIIACSTDPQGPLCQAFGGPCLILQQGCVSPKIPNRRPAQPSECCLIEEDRGLKFDANK